SGIVRNNELNRVVIDRGISDVYVILDAMRASSTKKNRSLYNKTCKSIKMQIDALNKRFQADFNAGNLDSQGVLNAYINRIETLKYRIKDIFSFL
ncbi:hypothetical protein IKQ21_05865, partial [bacterium]|nr:hypothetical protein [bacterium]